MTDAHELFESFLAREHDPATAFDRLCADHPALAATLQTLWDQYRHVATLLDWVGTEVEPGVIVPHARYEVRGEIAHGGMGRVLEVWDKELRRTLAMKVLRDEPSTDGSERAHWRRQRSRLINEAQILGQLEHPGIVPIHEVGRDARDRPYFTMLRVRGRQLGEIFDDARARRDGWTMTRALGVLLRVCEAVAHAHDVGVIHRDLKPSNVMVGPFGEVYVMDWGLAKARGREDGADIRLRTTSIASAEAGEDPAGAPPGSVRTDRRDAAHDDDASPLLTMDGDVLGTPSYMSPEQAAGRIGEVDERSDVYSAGAMLYHLLSGRAPYGGSGTSSTPLEVLHAVMSGDPEPLERIAPSATRELAAVCAKAMARERAARYATMADLATDLRAYLEGRVVQAYAAGPLVGLHKWVLRNKGAAAAIGASILGLVAVAVVQTVLKAELEQRAESLRERVYFNDVGLAQAAHDRGDIEAMKVALQRCPPDLRGWEWRCLDRMADTSELTLPHGHGIIERIHATIAVSRDGHTLVTCGWQRGSNSSVLRLWDAGTLSPLGSIEAELFARHVAISADGSRLLVSTNEGFLLVYGLSGRTLERKVDCRAGGRTPFVAQPSPDGRFLAIGRDDGKLELWSADTFEPVIRLGDGIRAFSRSVWSPDSRLLFVACADRETDADRRSAVRVYDVAAQRLIHELTGHAGWVDSVALSPDGSQLASSSAERVHVWDVRGAQITPRAIPDDVHGLAAWTPDGEHVLTATAMRVEVRDARTWRVEQVLVGHTDLPGTPVCLPGGRVATGDAAEIKLWRLDRRDRVTELPRGAPLGVGAFATMTMRGEQLALAPATGNVEIWDVPARRRSSVTEIPGRRVFLRYTPDGNRLLSFNGAGLLQVWDVRSSRCLAQVKAHGSAENFGFVDVDAAGRRCATTAEDGKVVVWDLDTLQALWSAPVGLKDTWPAGGHRCVFSPDEGRLLAVGAGDGRLRIFDTAAGRLIRELRADAKSTRYGDPAFSPDGRRVISRVYGVPLSLVVWDVMTGVVQWRSPGVSDSLWPVFTADGTRILSFSNEGALVVRDAGTGIRILSIAQVAAAERSVYGVSQDADIAMLGTTTGSLRFWIAQPWHRAESAAGAPR